MVERQDQRERVAVFVDGANLYHSIKNYYKGVLDYAHYIARLRASGFDGDLVAHGLSAEEAPEVARFLRGLLR